MHVHYLHDAKGDVVEIIPFCSDACHQDYCERHPDLKYEGWNGCNEGGDSVEFCAECGVVAGGAYECDCQRDNVVVNRIGREHGEQCKHGNWIQLPFDHPHLT